MVPTCVDLNCLNAAPRLKKFSSSLDINGERPYLYVVAAFGRLRPWYFGLDSHY
jgi:hypothetical protein